MSLTIPRTSCSRDASCKTMLSISCKISACGDDVRLCVVEARGNDALLQVALTKEVLHERRAIENDLENMQTAVGLVLAKVNELHALKRQLQKHKANPAIRRRLDHRAGRLLDAPADLGTVRVSRRWTPKLSISNK